MIYYNIWRIYFVIYYILKGFQHELIFYHREESAGPKLSLYNKCSVPDTLENMLKDALGTLGVVKKTRTLIIIGQTRVHFDSVEGLGDFVELEVSISEWIMGMNK